MKYLIQLLNYKNHFPHHDGHAIIIKNFHNVNIFVQDNFKSVHGKWGAGVSVDSILISRGYKNP